jgi:hypothetical protein
MVVLNGLGLAPPDPFLIYLENAGVPEGFRGPNDDPDDDGNTNLLEYLYESNPAVADWLGVYWNPVNSSANDDFFNNLDPGAGLDTIKRYRIVHVRTPLDQKGLTVELEAGLNLQDFGSRSVTVHPFGTPTNDGTHEIKTYYLTPSMDDAQKQFWRLKVER